MPGRIREHLQAIGESPQEKQDCHQSDWEDRLPDSQRRGARQSPIRHRLSVRLDLCIGGSALLEDLLRSWLLAFSEHLGDYATTPSWNRNSESERAISQSRPRWLPRKKFEDLIDLNRSSKGCSAGDEWWPSKNQAREASPRLLMYCCGRGPIVAVGSFP